VQGKPFVGEVRARTAAEHFFEAAFLRESESENLS
jgi:hypothetical protein